MKNISLPQLLMNYTNSSYLRLAWKCEAGTLYFNGRTERNKACPGTIYVLRCLVKICLEDEITGLLY